jgi:hypothetical protein
VAWVVYPSFKGIFPSVFRLHLFPIPPKITMVSAIPSAVSSVQSMHQAPAHKVLLLGSGFVAKPCLDFLSKEGIQVTVGEIVPGSFPLDDFSYST